jgi:hypothetical protein
MLSSYYLIICLIFCFALKSQACLSQDQKENNVQEESILEFAVCPKSNPYKREEGKVCCSEPIYSRFGCGETVDCPSIRCEDADNACGVYSYNFTNMATDYDGAYTEIHDILEANRPIFQNDDKCIWWHQPTRHWWIGPCENVGSDTGFAYIENDETCPDSEIWQRSGTNETIPDIDVYINGYVVLTEASGKKSEYQSGIAAVNVVVSQSTYRQQCRFKYRNGIYKCAKN